MRADGAKAEAVTRRASERINERILLVEVPRFAKGLFFLVLISAFQPPSLELDVDSLRGIFYLSNPKVVPYRFFKSLIQKRNVFLN